MPGIFTESRTLDVSGPFRVRFRSEATGNQWVLAQPAESVRSYQETTSYRSGGKYDDPLGDPLEGAGMYANARLALVDSADTGHEFSTFKQTFECESNQFTWTDAERQDWVADIVPRPRATPESPMGFPVIPAFGENEITVYGGRAIASTTPTSPHVNLVNTVSELVRDGLPRLFGVQTLEDRSRMYKNEKYMRDRDFPKKSKNRKLPSQGGSEYLNYEFGWLPLVSDVRKAARAAARSSQIMAQYKRDSGRIVRRGFRFPNKTTGNTFSEDIENGYNSFYGVSGGYFNGGHAVGNKVYISDQTSEQIWFKGAYTYYLDPGDDVLGKLSGFEQQANHLLGTRLTPANLWELAPWSWLADWESTVGVGLTNASSFQSDGLILRWGYLMRHYTALREVSTNHLGALPGSPRAKLLCEKKERFRASPYGFGLDISALSGRQWSILAALGLSKGDKTGW